MRIVKSNLGPLYETAITYPAHLILIIIIIMEYMLYYFRVANNNGIFLVMNYSPQTDFAFLSIEHL